MARFRSPAHWSFAWAPAPPSRASKPPGSAAAASQRTSRSATIPTSQRASGRIGKLFQHCALFWGYYGFRPLAGHAALVEVGSIRTFVASRTKVGSARRSCPPHIEPCDRKIAGRDKGLLGAIVRTLLQNTARLICPDLQDLFGSRFGSDGCRYSPEIPARGFRICVERLRGRAARRLPRLR